MWRYLAPATAIVAVALAVILALPRGAREPAPSHYSSGTGTPGPPQVDRGNRPAGPVRGDAPWALSALPACFHQRSSTFGPPAFARAHIPRGARRVPPSSVLRVADCTLWVGRDFALVERGEDRLRIPAVARFYVAGRRLILERTAGPREDVRAYTLAGGAPPAFAPALAAPKP